MELTGELAGNEKVPDVSFAPFAVASEAFVLRKGSGIDDSN
jgi:hypothetical protein